MDFWLEFSSTYTYLLGVIILFFIWCIVFLKKGINRREMLLAGVVFGMGAVLIGIKYALLDYWHPEYIFPSIHIEDFFYGFFFGGICTQIYFFFFKVKERTTDKHHPIFVFISLFISIFSFVILTGVFKLNSIVSHILPPIFIGLYIAYKDYKDIKVQIWSGLFATIITFIIFKILLLINPNFVVNIWYLNNLTGILIMGIPLEEYLFAFSLGFGVSIFYEFATGKELILKRKNS
ncbi:hypothetical protein A3A05_03690 [Candidatus Nomurabacteria bacterium RIFCSPLOWO2_01_FULL_41_12]|uniref:Lycopene cyclase domain-containing protein n=1 Tax=Candidatus Nomurabacteria bacterium RIFCSPLOWO2_01_FULL_41_12 TaxID=1801774 RepID=A0A1F6WUT8_9BACT|nr:MAG: hypothetical protein A3A05_03690 [Candidatus Nomurabacteria bacterium RIFCSPLOWO2_01_FULL_41_12]